VRGIRGSIAHPPPLLHIRADLESTRSSVPNASKPLRHQQDGSIAQARNRTEGSKDYDLDQARRQRGFGLRPLPERFTYVNFAFMFIHNKMQKMRFYMQEILTTGPLSGPALRPSFRPSVALTP
jgi:hypothetical protein